MRKRGIIFILTAIPAWGFCFRVFSEAHKSPFGYEFGSVAWPVPPLVRVIGIFAMFTTLIGLFLFAFDFVKWVRKKSHDATN